RGGPEEELLGRLELFVERRVGILCGFGEGAQVASLRVEDGRGDPSIELEPQGDLVAAEVEESRPVTLELAGVDGVVEEDVSVEPFFVGDAIDGPVDELDDLAVPDASAHLEDGAECATGRDVVEG